MIRRKERCVMNRADFVHKIAVNLRENGLKKPVRAPRQTFHISDDEGNSKDFVIKAAQRSYIYTEEDVRRVIDAACEELAEALKVGDCVTINGYGTIGLRYRKERQTKSRVEPHDMITVPAHHVCKLNAGKYLQVAAKIYDMNEKDAAKEIGYRYDELLPDDDE